MIKLRTIGRQAVLAAVFLATIFTANAGTTDTEGYPVMYLRGQQISSPWSADDSYRFTRSSRASRPRHPRLLHRAPRRPLIPPPAPEKLTPAGNFSPTFIIKTHGLRI
ncbi:MAG: hypothetical protein ACI4AX_01600 [Muribaculaceae bacterium]